MGKEPRKVSKIEDGYVFSHRDDSLGRDIYVKKTEAPPAKKAITAPKSMTGAKSVSTQTSTKPTVSKSPIKKISPPANTEDLIYIDPPAPTAVQQPNMPLYEDQRIARQLQTSINPNIDYYKLPDENAGYAKARDAYFDKATQREIDVSKSFGPNGDYLPSYLENAVKVNEGANLGTVKQGNPRVTTNPTQTYVLPGNENDKSGGMKGITGVGTGGYKKGGLVGKLKSQYAVGGVVSQNDNQPKRQQEKTPDQLAREEKLKSNVGAVFSGAGSSYYNSQVPESNGDSARSGALAGVSQAGAIGGVIGGVASIGDRIGKPIKQRSESLNSDGTLKNDSSARRNAIIGGIASPSKALAIRSSYKGGYSDISGKGYTAFLEKQAQDQIKEVEAANLASQQQQGLLNRDNNDFEGTVTTPYDLKNATFNKDKQLILGDGTMYDPNRPPYRKGGLVGKMKQACATGGKIVGKGTANSDSINATVKGDSYVIPAVNAPIAEEIRKKVLKAPVKKANLNQKSGEEVKLSNGEHLFTPEENEKLKQKGINLDVLAPNANETNSFDKGGKVKKDDKKEEAKSAISQVQRELGFSGDEELDYNKAAGNKKTYKELITPPMSWKGSKEAWKAAVDRSIRSGKVKPADSKTTTGGVRPPSSKKKVTPENMQSKNVALSTLKQDGELRSKKEVDNADMAINSTSANKEVKGVTPPKSKRNSNKSSLSNVDPTALVGIGQTALGLNSLKGLNRPVDKPTIDSTYNESVNRAVNDARFGLTPEQKFAADQDIQNSLNDSRAAAVNYSGGNGVQAFNLTRSAVNDAWRARLGLKTADTSLRMQKQQYADQQVAGRANVLASNRRRAYEDAMNTFQQKQQAESELIGAGLANTIGAYRFNQDMKARQNADYERNRWTTDYGNTLPTT